jgi:hypothetical protein
LLTRFPFDSTRSRKDTRRRSSWDSQSGTKGSMSSDPDTSSLPVAASAGDARTPASRAKPSRAALTLFVIVPTMWVLSAFLTYPLPTVSYWLVWLYLAGLPALCFLLLRALFRRRWKELALFCAMGTIVLLPYLGLNVRVDWIYVQGFRFHASPIEEYLSRCKLIEFVEKEATQKLGVCERHGWGALGTLTVIYDTTGELALPASQRTTEWAKVMARFSPGKFFTRSEGQGQKLFGNYYEISVPREEDDGAADEY